MNRSCTLCLSLAFAAAAGSALADDITIEPVPFASTATRAQVQEELREFRAAGVNPWSSSYDPLAQFRSTATREEVTAEFQRSRDEVTAFSGEDSGSTYLAQAGAPQRATVVAAGD